jgi:hypothetical protein
VIVVDVTVEVEVVTTVEVAEEVVVTVVACVEVENRVETLTAPPTVVVVVLVVVMTGAGELPLRPMKYEIPPTTTAITRTAPTIDVEPTAFL